MAWEERPYYRDGDDQENLAWWQKLLYGSFTMYRAFGIRVRIHISLILLIAFVLLFDYTKGYSLGDRAISLSFLFLIILLHEYGHCFAARAVGGEADDILMWPLGGLATAHPPRRPLPTFITIAAGPAVNLMICVTMAGMIWFLSGTIVSFNPFNPLPPANIAYFSNVSLYLWWIFNVSYWLFLFNLLPIYPLDGGQMLQSILWPSIGYYKSMKASTWVGMVGSVVLALYGLWASWLLLFIAGSCFILCYQKYYELKEMGPEDWAAEYDGMDYSVMLKVKHDTEAPRRKRRVSKWKMRRARRLAALEAAEQQQIDTILAKVSAQGMHSLTRKERRVLKRATERQRRREMESTR